MDTLRGELEALEAELNVPDATSALRSELGNVRHRLLEREQAVLELQADLRVLTQLSGDAGLSLDTALTSLQTVSDELAQLYHHVCAVNGETPNRVLLAHQKKDLPLQVRIYNKTETNAK